VQEHLLHLYLGLTLGDVGHQALVDLFEMFNLVKQVFELGLWLGHSEDVRRVGG
jgi:hypothetical protein